MEVDGWFGLMTNDPLTGASPGPRVNLKSEHCTSSRAADRVSIRRPSIGTWIALGLSWRYGALLIELRLKGGRKCCMEVGKVIQTNPGLHRLKARERFPASNAPAARMSYNSAASGCGTYCSLHSGQTCFNQA
jgi:hypothetical protein